MSQCSGPGCKHPDCTYDPDQADAIREAELREQLGLMSRPARPAGNRAQRRREARGGK